MTATLIAIVFAALLQGTALQEAGSESTPANSASAAPPLAQVDGVAASDDVDTDQNAVTEENADKEEADATAKPESEEVDMGRGIAIALSGMAIVAVALLLIIGFISSLPKILAVVANYFPEPQDRHSPNKSHPESQVAEDEAVLAAIGYVLHSRLNQDS